MSVKLILLRFKFYIFLVFSACVSLQNCTLSMIIWTCTSTILDKFLWYSVTKTLFFHKRIDNISSETLLKCVILMLDKVLQVSRWYLPYFWPAENIRGRGGGGGLTSIYPPPSAVQVKNRTDWFFCMNNGRIDGELYPDYWILEIL